jgi:hypothetical protein
MRTFIVLIAVALGVGCGKPTPGNNNGSTSNSNMSPDGGNNNADNVTTNTSGGTGSGGGGICVNIGEEFKAAVRAMPRDCTSDADCKLVERAQVCDCDLAVSASSDTAEYDDLRAQLDAESCSNPFGCPSGECPYRPLADPGELYAHCSDEGQCEVLQILSCEQYEERAHGGIANPGACMENTDCTLRNDLNPCGCNEAVSQNFPFLVIQSIAEMIEINDARCNVQCMGCESPGDAVCGVDGQGNQICQAM